MISFIETDIKGFFLTHERTRVIRNDGMNE